MYSSRIFGRTDPVCRDDGVVFDDIVKKRVPRFRPAPKPTQQSTSHDVKRLPPVLPPPKKENTSSTVSKLSDMSKVEDMLKRCMLGFSIPQQKEVLKQIDTLGLDAMNNYFQSQMRNMMETTPQCKQKFLAAVNSNAMHTQENDVISFQIDGSEETLNDTKDGIKFIEVQDLLY